MHKLRSAGTLLVLVALLASCAEYAFHGTLIDSPNPAPDFTLTDQSGQPFTLSEQRGKLVVMFFGFTSCPDFCPTTLAELAAVKRELGADAERVRFVMVTIDPERDTAERLQRYMATFDPSFIGLGGTQAEIDPVLKAYGVTAIRRELPDSALGYTMDHSTFVYAITPDGEWRAVFPYGMAPDAMADDIRYLLR